MSIEDRIYSAIAKALKIDVDISAHAIIRYFEREFKIDIAFEFLKKNNTRNFRGYHVTEATKISFIRNNYPKEYDIATDNLRYITRGRVSTFTDDGIKYIIRDHNLITVFEEN